MPMTKCDVNACIRRFPDREDLTDLAINAMINAFNDKEMRTDAAKVLEHFEAVIDVMRDRLT